MVKHGILQTYCYLQAWYGLNDGLFRIGEREFPLSRQTVEKMLSSEVKRF